MSLFSFPSQGIPEELWTVVSIFIPFCREYLNALDKILKEGSEVYCEGSETTRTDLNDEDEDRCSSQLSV